VKYLYIFAAQTAAVCL